MQVHANLSGNPGEAFELRQRAIAVEPAGGQGCLYDDAHAGHERIRRMRRMARTGRGLSTYISREIRGDYAERLHW
ncbi:MAG TPA: hypothetical protein VFK08_00545 [Rhodanobacteraceae bacterium]|nr:hypothetical protein [Rhodanobacteraceae bacterium]